MRSYRIKELTNSEKNLVDGIITFSDQTSRKVSVRSPEAKDEDINVERMLFYAGDFGRFQVLLMILFSIVDVFTGFHYFAQTFITTEPEDFRCAILDEDKNFTDLSISINELGFNQVYLDLWLVIIDGSILNPGFSWELINQHLDNHLDMFDGVLFVGQTRPLSEDKCKGYFLEMTEIVAGNKTLSKSIWKLQDCTKFEYDRYSGYESIVTELDWICKDSWKAAFGQSAFFIGVVTGTFILGIVADKWGRIKALIIAYILTILGNIMTAISNDFELFAVSRFIAGLAIETNYIMMYIIVAEYIRPSMRTFVLHVSIGIFFCLSCVTIPWIAVAVKTWRKFLVTVSVPMVIVPFYYLILPESASWLMTKGRTDQALKRFLAIAKMNGKVIPDDVVARFKEAHKDGDKPPQANLRDLFKGPKLRRKMIILAFRTMVSTLCYDAIWRNVNIEGASPFLVFSIGSTTILPACVVILVLHDKIGRKALFFLAVLLTGILTSTSGIMNALVPEGAAGALVPVSVAISVAARLCIEIVYNSGLQYAAELIPTMIKGRGVALIQVAGFAATFLSPLVLYLSKFWIPLPNLVLGLLCFICALATLFLPETLGRELPVTIEDGEIFGESEKPCEFFCCGGKKRQEDSFDCNKKINSVPDQ